MNRFFSKDLLGVSLVVCMLIVLAACGGQTGTNGSSGIQDPGVAEPAPSSENGTSTENNGEQPPQVTIEMESGELIVIELYPSIAPNTVNNFISLVKQGYYDGLIFHRVIPDFMIQGGDPTGTGMGGPGYAVKGEFADNGFENTLVHERGVISMARSQHPDSAGSQFFIMQADAPHLDGGYAAFGKVISGMEEVDRIVSVERGAGDKPVEPEVMNKVTVDTFGVEYAEPEKITP
jgi:peptidyl-prolyl cis-trans isomerase B (cyclophilin B)